MTSESEFHRAVNLHRSGRWAEAEAVYAGLLRREPGHFSARQLLALLKFQQGAHQDALNEIEAALALGSPQAETLAIKGNILLKLERASEALASFDRALGLKPDYPEALYNRGNCLSVLGRLDEAVESFSRALRLKPDYEPALTNRGNAFRALKRPQEALSDYDAAALTAPDDPAILYNRGQALSDLERHEEALLAFDAVLVKKPDDAEVWTKRGALLRELCRSDEALFSFNRALAIAPGHVTALADRAALSWSEWGRTQEALADLERAARLDPDYDDVLGNLLHLRMYGADWRDFARLKTLIDEKVRAGKKAVEPFAYQAISDSPADLKACAQTHARARFPERTALAQKPPASRSRLRLGYVSGEFRAQATAFLAAGLYERHDRGAFEVIGFDNGVDDKSPMRRRLLAAFDHFVDISGLGDGQAARRIAQEGIDILVNLNGYFGKHRMGVFAARPAPVQVNYLGFPGTLGAPYIDYILADPVVIPEAEAQFYSEKIVWLPDCYQVNDDRRAIGAAKGDRQAHGLPAQAFVFCNFNQSYKLTPELFQVWMRILRQNADSVLWLWQNICVFPANLRREAESHGVEGARLVFAPTLDHDAHLARLAHADLALDTLPYGAHTTASDALWAGVPLLTCRGRTFAGRVGASLLAAIGLPELIAETLESYESLALRLSRDRVYLERLRGKLWQNRRTHSLFDTRRYCRHLEAAYRRMGEIAAKGESPRSFHVRG